MAQDISQDQLIDKWNSVNWYTESQTLTFWSKSSIKNHNLSRHVKMWNFFIKKSKSQDFILRSQNYVLESSRSCFEPISHVLGQKSNIGHSQSKS